MLSEEVGRICSKCKVYKTAEHFGVRKRKRVPRLESHCRECKLNRASERYFERRRVDPVALWLSNARSWAMDRARKKGIEFSIEKYDVENALFISKKRCFYCGIDFNFQRTIATRVDSPTIDRVIPSLGYTKDNIVVCCYRCNALKGNASPFELDRLASMVNWVIKERGLGC